MSVTLNITDLGAAKGISSWPFSLFLNVFTLSVLLNTGSILCVLLLRGQKLKYERENRMKQKYFEIVKTNETILIYLDINYRLNCEL